MAQTDVCATSLSSALYLPASDPAEERQENHYQPIGCFLFKWKNHLQKSLVIVK
ncbi:MAG: hypothetical protein K2K97_03945 [Muribaculaceae bacterium]|nr:hypothetical protein [Muribaculaceae bacterium]